MSTPHLSYFRRDGHGYHFRVRRDGQYWNANRAILSRFGKSLKWSQERQTFNLPVNAHTMTHLSLIFPDEWAIIEIMTVDEIAFEESEEGEL